MATIIGTDSTDKLTGTAGNDIIDGLKDKDAMYGGKGNDIYFVDTDVDAVFENANQGIDLVKSTVSYVLSDNVENLTLLGNGSINASGNALNNVLTGNDGTNVLIGGAGKDTMIGGKGDDVYDVDNAGDKVVESVGVGGGNDIVVAHVSYSIAGSGNVENLTLVDAALIGTGNALANTLNGNSNDNILNGGVGADTMTGGSGDDTYAVDNAGDVVKEDQNDGTDTIISSIAFSGAVANVENYIFNTGAAVTFSGNGLDNQITGGSGNDTLDGGGTGQDVLFGRAGDDTLSGGSGADYLDGGTGADVMTGFASDDVYFVDSLKDQVIEQANAGNDGVGASISIAKLYDNVEQLILLGKADLNGTGNDLDNHLYGNDGRNVLDGGKGMDWMDGGRGNDVYIVDNAGDTVHETDVGKAGGIDLVKSAVDFTLGANVENLILTGTGDTLAKGNALANVLVGNDGNNQLDGGAGNDTMIGGKGDDTYHVADAGDKVIETLAGAAGGTDGVISQIDFSIAGFANVEYINLTGTAIKATGNALDNAIGGDSQDNILDGGKGADTMWGDPGNDTFVFDNVGDWAGEGKNQGTDTVVSRVALTSAFDNVENYTFITKQAVHFSGNALDNVIRGGSGSDTIDGGGSGADSLYGNAGNDTLTGGALADYLDGGKGADSMSGLAGDDTYFVDNLKDKVVELGGGGNDVVIAAVSIAKLFDEVEQLQLAPGKANLNGTGNDLDNHIEGNDGNNVLNGGLGKDVMYGFGGNDTYVVDNIGDQVVESANGGKDLVRSSVNFTLGTNIESLILTGKDDISGIGNALNNVIVGNAGENYLDGKAGADLLIGGAGNDTYIVDNKGDRIVEGAKGGVDWVFSDVDFSFAKLAYLENLALNSTAIHATGNALGNTIIGNDMDNDIDGGKGADTMTGGKGADIYHVDNIGDVVHEQLAQGIDTIVSTIALSKAVDNVENYTFVTAAAVHFTGSAVNNVISGGSGADELIGGGGLDTLHGNGGNDVLSGGSGGDYLDGGSGIDTMSGHAGDDIYIVDNAKDVVLELLNEGTDEIDSSVSIGKLADNVENLVLIGHGNLSGTGNALDNIIFGNDGANALSGGDGADMLVGGAGNDTLSGGAGADTFYFDTGKAGGHDTVTDFVKAEDVLDFTGVTDTNNDGKADLTDLLAHVSSVVDHGAGKAVDVVFDSGASVTFNGAGTGAVNSIDDLVANAATQIHVN